MNDGEKWGDNERAKWFGVIFDLFLPLRNPRDYVSVFVNGRLCSGRIEELREFSWIMTTAMKKGLVRNVTLRRLLAVASSLILCNLNAVQAAREFRHNFKQGKFLPAFLTTATRSL